MLTGSYGVPIEDTSLAVLADQARLWIDNIPDDDENDDWVDAERANLTEAMLDAYCDVYDQRSRRQRLTIYTGFPWWTKNVVSVGRAERYEHYGLVEAGYPFDTGPGVPPPMDPASIARRSNPPALSLRPPTPAPWTSPGGWQYSGQGSKPGYGTLADPKFLDHGIYLVNPSPSPAPPVFHPALVGLHGRADGRMQSADFNTVRQAKIEAVKLLTTAAPEDVDALRSINTSMLIVVRIFMDFRGRVITPEQFVRDSGVSVFHDKGVRLFEIHNEPNLKQEGLSMDNSIGSWRNGFEFGTWFADVYGRLKAQFPDSKFGFPGLSPGPFSPGERMDEREFLDGATSAFRNADWGGLHVYWNDDTALADAMSGKAAREYALRFPNKPIYITEFSNAQAQPKSLKGQQYVQFYKACQSSPNVVAAFSFVSSSSQGFVNETWRDEDGTQTAITAIVGNRSQATPVPVHVIEKGSKIGMHSFRPKTVIPFVQKAVDRGIVWPLVKAIADAGVGQTVKALSPQTITITRFVNTAEDSAQGVETWTQTEMVKHAHDVLAFAMGNSIRQAQLRSGTDFIEPINEADPPGVNGHTAFGKYLCEMVRQANALGIHIIIPAFNSGTPEWSEMVALTETGLFGLMKAGGHALAMHEGTVRGNPVDLGFGDRIPGAPVVAGAGSQCCRYRYLYHILKQRNEVVPLVISEFYGSGSYSLPPAEQVERFAWYDNECRKDPYVLAVLPFTIDSIPGGDWADQDYTYAYPAVLDYLDREKNLPNATEDSNMDETTRLALIDDQRQISAKAAHSLGILNSLAPIVWKVGDVALANTNPLITYVAPNGAEKDKRPPTPPGGPMITYDLNVLEVTTDQLWLRVAVGMWVKSGSVKKKV